MIFALEKYDDFFENQVVKAHSLMRDIPIRRYETTERIKKFELENPDQEYIVIGSISWIESYLGFSPKPDYYPEFLKDWFGRKIWFTDVFPATEKVFIKPSDKYKRFNGFIIKENSVKQEYPFVCSEVVNFINEWRYYIAYGEVIFSAWYHGENENCSPPDLDIKWPQDYVGAVDFGITDNGAILLVETQHPYGIGWYGSTNVHEAFIKWSIAGWRYMKKMIL